MQRILVGTRDIRPPWGKLGQGAEAGREQSLVGHCRDVSAIFVSLLRLPGVRWRLARLSRSESFRDEWIERLAWFVFLHDLGKVNWGFQARREPGAPFVGHVAPIAARSEDIVDRLEPGRCLAWGDEAALADFFDAALSHHGKPWRYPEDPNASAKWRRYWDPKDGYAPLQEVEALRRAADRLFPAARTIDGLPLPLTTPLIHTLAGLVMLADWIASSDWPNSPTDESLERWAEQWLVRIGLDPAPWRAALANAPSTFEAAFGFAPRPAQAAFASAEGALVLLESDTGSGKTEAALWRFVEAFRAGRVDGLFFALPTRTAAAQLFRRVAAFTNRIWPVDAPPCVLAAPGYLDDDACGALPDAADPLDLTERDGRGAPLWAAEHPKRYFSALISVGTIDQALLSVLKVKHAHMRGAALMRHMLVVDEVHASDAYMSRILETLLDAHLAAGGEAALLSATLGAEARGRYLGIAVGANPADIVAPSVTAAIDTLYPAISTPSGLEGVGAGAANKTISVSLGAFIDDPSMIVSLALAAARTGAKVLVVRNTVSGAVDVLKALEMQAGVDAPELFRVNGVTTLHHGRFAREDRRRLDGEVEARLGKTRPLGGLVLVGTQTLEQSLDIDADFLITDLAPMDVLLQRMGRLHRHRAEANGAPRRRPDNYANAKALVLTPADGLPAFLGKLPAGRRRHGLGPVRGDDGVPRGVYPDLLILEATRRVCVERPIWRIPAMNRELVERSIHAQAIEALIERSSAQDGDAWRRHFMEVTGARHGDRVFASLGTIDRRLPFMDDRNAFLDDEKVVTRLGEAGVMIDLPPGAVGPFGEAVSRLVLPAWWGKAGAETDPVVTSSDGEMRLRIGDDVIVYDRFGLQKGKERAQT
jgi:CRISPR-associated endonuclease/helicase Cas3